MSEWKLPKLAPPQYLGRKIEPISDYELNFYSSELGITNTLKKARLYKNPNSFTNNISYARSEVKSSSSFKKSRNTRRWTRFKSNLKSCLKSAKCKFTALGVLLGLGLSLIALIPIVVVWQTSTSNSKTTTATLVGTATGFGLNASSVLDECNQWFCQEEVWFTTNMTVKTLLVEVRVQRTANATYNDFFTSNDPLINATYTTTSSELIYTFFNQGGQEIPAGTYRCAVQFDLSNMNQTVALDKYSVQVINICGLVSTASGYFSR